MIAGDFVRLHIHPGRREILDLPADVGTIQAIDAECEQIALVVRFASMSVYIGPITAAEVEVVSLCPSAQSGLKH